MIFITGATGFIGSYIARQLISQGNKLIVLKRANSDTSLLVDIADQLEWVEGELTDVALMAQVMQRCDTVIHCAATISFSPRNRALMYYTNVEGTKALVNVALETKTAKFCYISSVAAVGRKKEASVITENGLWEENETNTHYAKSKYLAELEVWRGIEEGLPAFIVCPSIVLGPGNWLQGSSQLFKYVYSNQRFYPLGAINYVDVRDVAEIVQLLLSKSIVGERYILNAETISYKLLFERMAFYFKVPPPYISVKKWMSEVLWRIERVRGFFSKKEPVLTKETAKMAAKTFSYSNAKIVQELGYTFTPIEETLAFSCNELIRRYVNK